MPRVELHHRKPEVRQMECEIVADTDDVDDDPIEPSGPLPLGQYLHDAPARVGVSESVNLQHAAAATNDNDGFVFAWAGDIDTYLDSRRLHQLSFLRSAIALRA